ncbi:LOW QUALITY PROTEIN: hypothetical protein CRUP_018375 [Coryphaenoides rupestris]|nr:LOW QUALITY PROTEIN: hypothetical protein CRUP_018375 [Coryphaenoides rupestris]
MDFDNILSIASQNQGLSSVQQKRYSLQTGPPKKDPKSKLVNSTAVQAFLKKKAVELKSDRKARAMASRTKDNFRGYNGIPVVEEPKKRRSKGENVEEVPMVNCYDPADEDNYEYEQTDSESEEAEPQRPPRRDARSSGSGVKASAKKPSGQPKPPPPHLNFAELLKLAEKKQFEPVEVKTKPVKKEGRLRTAEEIREIELERKAKRLDKGPRDSQPERDRESKSQPGSSASRKSAPEKEHRNGKPAKSSSEKSAVSNASGKKSKSLSTDTRDHGSSSKPSFKERDRDRDRPKSSQSDRDRPMSSSSGALTNPSRGTPSQVKPTPRSMPGHKSSTPSDLSSKKGNSTLPQGRPGPNPTSRAPGQRPQTSVQPRPGQGSSLKGAAPSGDNKGRKGDSAWSKLHGEPEQWSHKAFVWGPTQTRGKPSAETRGKPSAETRGKPSAETRGKPSTETRGKPSTETRGKPSAETRGEPSTETRGEPSTQTRGKPSTETRGAVGLGVYPREVGLGVYPREVGLRMYPRAVGLGEGHKPGLGAAVSRVPLKLRGGLGMPLADQAPGRPSLNPGLGPGRPKCTVVSETISVSGARPGVPPRPGGPPRPGMPARPVAVPYGSVRPGAPTLPPITSTYKRKYDDEEEEYDSEMDDFIDDGGGDQEEVSKHIREIFGYDRSKYKGESDYALKFMESSWRDVQKEEARSLRLAVEEDLEEERREEEEIKRHAKRKKM